MIILKRRVVFFINRREVKKVERNTNLSKQTKMSSQRSKGCPQVKARLKKSNLLLQKRQSLDRIDFENKRIPSPSNIWYQKSFDLINASKKRPNLTASHNLETKLRAMIVSCSRKTGKRKQRVNQHLSIIIFNIPTFHIYLLKDHQQR